MDGMDGANDANVDPRGALDHKKSIGLHVGLDVFRDVDNGDRLFSFQTYFC